MSQPMSEHRRSGRLLYAIFISGLASVWLSAQVHAFQTDELRQWSDATGRFKVTAKLLEVADGNVILESEAGKTVRIPLARLSAADQAFLNAADNPFEMIDDADATSGTSNASRVAPPTASSNAADPGNVASGSASGGWGTPKEVDWNVADEVLTTPGVEWAVPLPKSGELDFEPKRAPLPKKTNFHEGMHPLAVNAVCRRAAIGFTASFAVPKPASRLSLVDLVSGKAIHSEQVEANMRPIVLLDSGSAVLMVGASDERGGYETPDQLQVWRLQGKKIVRTPSWIPYPNDKEDRGKRQNAIVFAAEPISENTVLTLSDKGHVVLWDIFKREPIWHARMDDSSFAMAVSLDRQLIALSDDKTLLVVNASSGEVLGSSALDNSARIGWNRVCWSPSGKRILFTAVGEIRLFNVETGEWEVDMHFSDVPIATNALSYPHEDFALLDNRLLVHLPTKIQVCDYEAANAITTLGGTSFIGVQEQNGGLLVPAKFPHPAAEELLAKAQSDPTVFLVHPGVQVAVDVSGAGQYQAQVKAGLETAIKNSGYQLDPSAPIKIAGAISGPKQEAISYIARGSYVFNEYKSNIKMTWNGKELWSTGGSNVPGMLMRGGDETIEQALAKAGQSPNLDLFAGVKFPEFIQRPSESTQPGAKNMALMSSKFTLQGLVDSK